MIKIASQDQFIKIAMNCSRYNPEGDSLTSSTEAKKEPSCEYCSHFTAQRRCELDLIDKILSSMAMELE